MHIEAYQGFARMIEKIAVDTSTLKTGLDVGGRNVNGSVREQLPGTAWTGLDIRPGPDVDIVADAAEWIPEDRYDIVIATELFEHAERWPLIVRTMFRALKNNGIYVSTCASTGRPPHGASGEWGVPDGEWYGNVDPKDLERELERWFDYVYVEYNPNPGDVYAVASLPRKDRYND